MYGRLSPNKRESGQSHQKSPLAGVEACHRDHRHASTCVNTRDPDLVLVFYLDLQRDLCHSDSRNQSAKHLNVCEHWDLDLEPGLSPVTNRKDNSRVICRKLPKNWVRQFHLVKCQKSLTINTRHFWSVFVFEKIVSAEPTPKKTVCHHYH